MPEPPEAAIAVVAAMRQEIAPLRRRLRGAVSGRDGPLTWHRGELRGADVVLAATGEGRRRAADGIARVVARHAPARVLGIGLGGALSPELGVGDLLLASEVRDGEEAVAAPDHRWLARARELGGWPAGRLVTVGEILATPAAKARWREAGRPDQLAVADLESASWARVAAAHRLPYLVARAVSDRADEALPSFLALCRRPDGAIDRRRVLAHAARRPASWGPLVRLWARTRRCARRLADLAEVLVAESEETGPAGRVPGGGVPPAG